MEKLTRLPPGFRFRPTDEELVVQYLKRKATSSPLPAAIIPEIVLGNHDPWDLPGCFEGEKYFFNLQEARYRNGNRSNRATRSGYWKATGREQAILCSKRNVIVGMKKVLAFHQVRYPGGARTHWFMHEYRLVDHEIMASTHIKNPTKSPLFQDHNWVVCHIFVKKKASRINEDMSQYYDNLQARNNDVVFVEMNHMMGGDSGSQSPTSSCITDLSDEECSKVEEANSNLIASSP
ncbi:uncharacterized protein A4U43_C10F4490 [Asparagus officinalis]|uniref:NAC domain-containing protein n=1 Tax=Asparagus officinalis TaxID=4686 RepID=A0A5P1E534_ASPOF|nr:NAC domain-containing protein 83-like [Asparagus officinalis]ONK56136.1 uncharacterized protein A4U43_C10F4490 [Asparagus officinalis]